MFETLKRLYESDKINDAALSNAVCKGWITEEQKNKIVKEITREDAYAEA